MPCGRKPLRKMWDKPNKNLKTVKPSRYEQNEPCVKLHWKNVIKQLEMSYTDEQFWESNYQTVRELVEPITYERIAKIFNLPLDELKYRPKDSDDESSVEPSENYHNTAGQSQNVLHPAYSATSYESSLSQEEGEEEWEEDSIWSTMTSETQAAENVQKSHSKGPSKHSMGKSFSKTLNKSLSKFLSKSTTRSMSGKITASKTKSASEVSPDDEESAKSDDDILVHPSSPRGSKHRREIIDNPHFDMLYCNDNEADMIKWNSKYKQTSFEVSASDEFSKKAEIVTKKIAHEFYDWWISLGNVEFISEIKRPQDIEELFQVWFDEHASRGLVIDPKIIPCVLESISNYIDLNKASCPSALNRQIEWDIHAETSPAHNMAFGTCLPLKLKHIPPRNSTEKTWRSLKIPEELRTMEAVWGGISHLTSTKSFLKWLEQQSDLPIPECLRDVDSPKQQLFVVPSDYVLREKSMEGFSEPDLAFPVSQFSIEIKAVLSKLLSD